MVLATPTGVHQSIITNRKTWKVFKGQPKDLQSTRITELYISFDEDEGTNVTIRMQGEYPHFRPHEEWNQPMPWMRPNFFRRLAVTSFMTTGSELNMRVRDAIWDTPINNPELDYTCQSWVGDVGECLPRRCWSGDLNASHHCLVFSSAGGENERGPFSQPIALEATSLDERTTNLHLLQ